MSTKRQIIKIDASSVGCPHLDDSPRLEIIDPDGDLHLVVGQNECLLSSYIGPDFIVRRGTTTSLEVLPLPGSMWTDFCDEPSTTITLGRESDSDVSEREEELLTKCREALEEEHEHNQATTFVVCSKALSRASPFFKHLLYGGFSESEKPKGDAKWTVHLPEDHVGSIWLLASIAHGCFNGILPEKAITKTELDHLRTEEVDKDNMSLDRLYELTITTDKYNMAHLLRPFAHKWLRSAWDTHWYPAGNIAGECTQFLWIAWELGDVDVFKQCVDLLASQCFLNDDGQLVAYGQRTVGLFHVIADTENPLFKNTMEPPGVYGKLKTPRSNYPIQVCLHFSCLDLIYNRRIELLDQYFEPLRAAVAHPLRDPFPCTRKECNARLLGRMIIELSENELWPIPDTEEYESSVSRVGVAFLCASSGIRHADKGHWSCPRKFKKWLLRLGKEKPSLTLPEVLERHLKAQAAKTGLISEEEKTAPAEAEADFW